MTREEYLTLRFPIKGMDVSAAYMAQRPLTTVSAANVRAYDPTTQRARGASRSGLTRFINAVVGTLFVNGMGVIVTTAEAAEQGGGAVQTSESGRVVTLVVVDNGNVKTAVPGDTAWTSPTGGTGVLSATGRVFMASNNGIMYFADGTNWQKYNPATPAVSAWTASAGTLPVDSNNNAPRLICNWRGRVVLSGLIGDPQDIFMSAVGDGTDFDYSPSSQSPTQAVSLGTGNFGQVGAPITCLIPYTDDVLVIGTDSGIWLLRGDPMAGGSLDLVSNTIGMAWGKPYCQSPDGVIYFMSNKLGVYTMLPGQAPQRISQPIDNLLVPIDTGGNAISMAWNDRYQGAHLFVTPTVAAAPTTHYFFESRTGAWWPDSFASDQMDPLCCEILDGNDPDDRVTLIGCWDGYVRSLDPNATTDDQQPIESSVMLGPLLTQNFDKVLVKDIQAVLRSSSTAMSVEWAAFVGRTAEAALAAPAFKTGTWTGGDDGSGREYTNQIRAAGHALYLQLSSSSPWAMEAVRARVVRGSRTTMRGR